MSLSPSQKRYLRGLCHHLKPVVMVGGKGLSESVLKEIDRALLDHELIKVRVSSEDRDDKRAAIDALLDYEDQLVHIDEIFQRLGLLQPTIAEA